MRNLPMYTSNRNGTARLHLFIVLLFWVLSSTILGQNPTTESIKTSANPPQVRMRWQDFSKGPDGQKRLSSFLKAISKMKSLDQSPKDSADYRRSWQYWANVHGYYGTNSPDGSVEAMVQYLKD